MSPFRSATALILAFVLTLAVFDAAGAQRAPQTPFQPPPPQDLRAPPDEPTEPLERPDGDKTKILGDLYDQLRETSDEQSAELIADTIERLWLRSGSDTVDLLMARAIKMVQEEELDVALKILDAIVSIDPKYAEGWNQRATVHFLKKDYSASLGDLRHVLRIDPRHYKAINGLALILSEFGDKTAALKAFRKALAVHPFLADAKQAVRELMREVEGQGI